MFRTHGTGAVGLLVLAVPVVVASDGYHDNQGSSKACVGRGSTHGHLSTIVSWAGVVGSGPGGACCGDD